MQVGKGGESDEFNWKMKCKYLREIKRVQNKKSILLFCNAAIYEKSFKLFLKYKEIRVRKFSFDAQNIH
jgi:hypothetical protein